TARAACATPWCSTAPKERPGSMRPAAPAPGRNGASGPAAAPRRARSRPGASPPTSASARSRSDLSRTGDTRGDAPRRGISASAIGLLAGWLALGAVLALVPGAPGVVTFAFVVAGWMLALVAHEFGHAFVAWKAGDHTVAEKGYLTLDPIKYADLGTSLVIPMIALALGGIGFPGGAVYLREDLMRSPAWRSAASLAGPAGTLAMFVTLSAAAQFWLGLYGADGIALSAALAFLAFLQATALILNLLPVPGLDGWGVIRPFLP